MSDVPEASGYSEVEAIRQDRTHGSAYLSRRALEVLRDQAHRQAVQEQPDEAAWEALRALARSLIAAQPTMAVLRNRVNRVMHGCRATPSAAGVARGAQEVLDDALNREHEAAVHAAGYIAGRRVFTLSRSGTVLRALLKAKPSPTVLVAESRPGGEGVDVAEELAAAGLTVMLLPDAAITYALTLMDVEVVLIGADAVLPAGHVVNKVGTHALALAARQASLPCYVAATSDKVSSTGDVFEPGEASERFYAGEASVQVVAPLFEQTPARLFSGVITEVGLLAMREIQDLAYELKGLEAW